MGEEKRMKIYEFFLLARKYLTDRNGIILPKWKERR